MSLLARVSEQLLAHRIEHAVIGAAALAVHGVARATADLDLLATDRRCLEEATWEGLRAASAVVGIRIGDESDPLAGVARFTAKDEAPIDLIVGRTGWQTEVLRRAEPAQIIDVTIPVACAPDLVLLKLYAGGPQDAWDVDQLLDVDETIAAEVERRIAPLPPESVDLWRRIRRQREEAR